jgi:hypothetical protein
MVTVVGYKLGDFLIDSFMLLIFFSNGPVADKSRAQIYMIRLLSDFSYNQDGSVVV